MSFQPTATLEALRLRAELLRVVRQFFDARGYFEVETPLLSRDAVVDPHLECFEVPGGGLSGESLYLQTSPEFCMKRLLAAGATAIYQLGKVFRKGERGSRHNPEFTMLEWYRVGDTYLEQMTFVEELVAAVFAATGAASRPATRVTYRDAFIRHTGLDAMTLSTAELVSAVRELGITAPETMSGEDRDGWLNLLLGERVEPRLGKAGPEFLYDYPASQAAIAKVRPPEGGQPAAAERFELYVNGIELCNGYTELTDPQELRRRMQVESARRVGEGLPALAPHNRLLEAMERGLPDSAGVALGFDRLVMVAGGFGSLDEVLAFPIERA